MEEVQLINLYYTGEIMAQHFRAGKIKIQQEMYLIASARSKS